LFFFCHASDIVHELTPAQRFGVISSVACVVLISGIWFPFTGLVNFFFLLIARLSINYKLRLRTGTHLIMPPNLLISRYQPAKIECSITGMVK